MPKIDNNKNQYDTVMQQPCWVATSMAYFINIFKSNPNRLYSSNKSSYYGSKLIVLNWRSSLVSMSEYITTAQYTPIINAYDIFLKTYASGPVDRTKYTESGINQLTAEGVAALELFYDTYIQPLKLCTLFPSKQVPKKKPK